MIYYYQNFETGGDSMKKLFAIGFGALMILSLSSAAIAAEPQGFCDVHPCDQLN